MKTVNIMGTKYTIEYLTTKKDPFLSETADGYCDWTTRRIVIQDPKEAGGNLGSMDEYWKAVLRHEIVHAFLFECGLRECVNNTEPWAKNEEVVDWIANTGPKIIAAWQDAGAL